MDSPEISPQTENAATLKDAFPMHDLALVGTLISSEGARAVLRRPNGSVFTRSVGQQIDRNTVYAIEDGSVLLARHGVTWRLEMPETGRA